MPVVRIGDQTFEIERRPQEDGEGDLIIVDGSANRVSLKHLSGSTYLMMVGGRPRVVTVEENGEGTTVSLDGQSIKSRYLTDAELTLEKLGMEAGAAATHKEIRAPMPGLLLRVLVEPGETVAKGQGLVVLEAMKMENELSAPADGTVATVHVDPGASVAKNDLLVELD